jgi:hypothetical protein
VPDGSGYGEIVNTPMKVTDFRRAWRGEEPYWYLAGRLADCPEKWYIDRKAVTYCRMHVLFWYRKGYVQLVPNGGSGNPPLPPTGEEFRWGDLSSRTLPPKSAG